VGVVFDAKTQHTGTRRQTAGQGKSARQNVVHGRIQTRGGRRKRDVAPAPSLTAVRRDGGRRGQRGDHEESRHVDRDENDESDVTAEGQQTRKSQRVAVRAPKAGDRR
jgi:hypothetical protein